MYEELLFHNVGEFENVGGIENALVRTPKAVRANLNHRAKFVGMESVGAEVRFVTDAPNFDVYLTCIKNCVSLGSNVQIYKGNFLVDERHLKQGLVECVTINNPDRFLVGNEKMLYSKGFSPDVWRIVFDRGVFKLNAIDSFGYEVRAPKKDELPAVNFLAYGSSITNSSLNGYPHVAARILGVDVQNMGYSGACHIEPEMVDYLTQEREFDFITCELGVNMRPWYTPEEFEKRTAYLLKKLNELGKPAIIISIFTNCHTKEYTLVNEASQEYGVHKNHMKFNEIIQRLVEEMASPNIHFVSGDEILTDVTGLSADLLHPTVFGHSIMGMNLANKIKEFKIV